MIHGPENKGNLNLLYNIVQKGFPWPLSNFVNQRSFCSIDNLIFILNELITNENIPSGIYNIADDETMSTNDLVKLIADSIPQKLFFLKIPKFIIYIVAYIGTILKLKINLENLQKLTENYVVNNSKIKNAINKNLPFSTQQGLSLTISSFKHNKL